MRSSCLKVSDTFAEALKIIEHVHEEIWYWKRSFFFVRLESPCEGCEAPYSFKNQLKLNKNTSLFEVRIQQKFKLGPVIQKGAFEHVQNAQIQVILRLHKISSGPLFSIRTFLVSDDSVGSQRRPWSDCIDVQSDLGLWCPQMPEDTFTSRRPNGCYTIFTLNFWTQLLTILVLKF